MSKSSDFLAFTSSLSEGKEGPFKKMLHKNAIGVLRTFTGPFSGLIEPVVDAGFDMSLGRKKKLSVTHSEYRTAKQMASKGFNTVAKFKDEDDLQFFKNHKDASTYAERQKLKVEWVGLFSDIEVR